MTTRGQVYCVLLMTAVAVVLAIVAYICITNGGN